MILFLLEFAINMSFYLHLANDFGKITEFVFVEFTRQVSNVNSPCRTRAIGVFGLKYASEPNTPVPSQGKVHLH